MKKFLKVVGIGAAICTGVSAAVAVTKKIINKNNVGNEDVVEDEESEFEEPTQDSETTDSTKIE